jgi:hypothetical protein
MALLQQVHQLMMGAGPAKARTTYRTVQASAHGLVHHASFLLAHPWYPWLAGATDPHLVACDPYSCPLHTCRRFSIWLISSSWSPSRSLFSMKARS